MKEGDWGSKIEKQISSIQQRSIIEAVMENQSFESLYWLWEY
jgi:hypothetical protein